MARFRTLTFAGASAAALVVAALASGAGKPQANPDYGFVVSKALPAFYYGDEKIDCPDGRSPTVRESFLLTQTPEERARLLKPENSIELERRYKVDYVYGADGRDICSSAPAFDTPDRPMQKPVQSKIAPGMDLDGANGDTPAPGTCAHKSFTGLAGEAGVDNQYFRAIACNTFWRGAGTDASKTNSVLPDGIRESQFLNVAVVMIVRGLDNWQNDPKVEVVMAASPDEPPRDVQQKIVGGGSLAVTDNARWRVTMNGRIENGVLVTEPTDMIMPRFYAGAARGEFIMKRARLRLTLQPNGELKGEAGGYRPIDNIIGIFMVGGPGVASTSGLDCASVRKTLRILADGDPDPKTGACTTVSQAMDVVAKPAFVFEKGALVAAPGGRAVRMAQR